MELDQIERDSTEPVALQTYRIVTRAVENSDLLPGARLPSEREMASSIGVSRVTLRKALTSLQSDGLVESSAQRGWFIPETPLSEPPNVLQSFTEMARNAGFAVTTRVIAHTVRTATYEEAKQLNVAPTSLILDVRRLRLLNDSPICVDWSRLPESVAAPIFDLDQTDSSIFDLMTERCGVTPSRADFEVAAEAASPQVAELLNLEEGAPILVGYDTTYDQEGRMIMLGRSSYRGDAYRFQASLFRL